MLVNLKKFNFNTSPGFLNTGLWKLPFSLLFENGQIILFLRTVSKKAKMGTQIEKYGNFEKYKCMNTEFQFLSFFSTYAQI
jgi:hypothetical protein